VGLGLPSVQASLLARSDFAGLGNIVSPPPARAVRPVVTDALTPTYPAIWPSGVSVGILSFGAQNVVPTLLKYLGGNPTRTRKAVLLGSVIPLVMYSLWEAVFLGNVAPGSPGADRMQVFNALGSGAPNLQALISTFSACAIGSSMAGAAVSLVDFFADGLAREGNVGGGGRQGLLGKRWVAASLALAPPLGLTLAYPDAFLGALENAGLLGGVSLYGVLPALAVLNLRRNGSAASSPLTLGGGGLEGDALGGEAGEMPGRLWGGDVALGGIALLSGALLVPEILRLAGV